MIRFYHKEMEAYLVAEGLFDDELLEDGKYLMLLIKNKKLNNYDCLQTLLVW